MPVAHAAFEQRVDSELPGGVPVLRLEIAGRGHQARALAGDEGVVDRFGRRRAARIAGRLLQAGSGEVVAHDAKVPRRQLVVAGLRVDETKDRLDEADAGGHVEPVHGDQRKERPPAPHHRPVRVERLAHPRLEIRPGPGNDDARDRVLDEGVEQVLLAREVVMDAHRLAAEALAEPARRQAGERRLADEGRGRRRRCARAPQT
jgi:hypothetical protein